MPLHGFATIVIIVIVMALLSNYDWGHGLGLSYLLCHQPEVG